MYPTRPGRLHLILALGALVVLLIAQQQRTFDFPGSARVASGLHDATHGMRFALVAWFVAGFVRRFVGRGATIAITALGVGIAIGTEVLQTRRMGIGFAVGLLVASLSPARCASTARATRSRRNSCASISRCCAR